MASKSNGKTPYGLEGSPHKKSAGNSSGLSASSGGKAVSEGIRTATKKPPRKKMNFLVLVLLTVVITFICSVSLAMVLAYFNDLKTVRDEFASLQEIADIAEAEEMPEAIVLREPAVPLAETAPYVSAFDMEMREINPDYLCWIKIDDTRIDYPVVRTDDNEKYLELSFYGEINYFGSLFMDYRCIGESVPHLIIYGHNSRHGDLFGGMRYFLDERYLAEHPVITLQVNDRLVEYEIFSARFTTTDDPAYFLDFSAPGSFDDFAERCGAPAGASQILTLSTCYSGGNDSERVIVQGVLR